MFMMSMAPALQAKISINESMFSYIPYKSATWNEKRTIQSEAGVNTIEQNVWYKDSKMRTEGEYVDRESGKKADQVIIVTDKFIYILFPQMKKGMKKPIDEGTDAQQTQSLNKFRKDAKKSGSEKINGENCDIYKYTFNTTNGENKIYAEVTEWRNSDGFPLKSETYMKISGGKETTMKTVTEISNLKTNADVPDSKFVPDSSIELMDSGAVK